MKKFKLMSLLLLVLALASLASCGPTQPEELLFKIEGEKEFNLSESQNTVSVKLLSNRDWRVRMGDSASDWIVVEPSSGKASSSAVDITITVLANTGTNRETAIEFYTGTAAEMVTIRQEGPGGEAVPKPSGAGTLDSPYNVAAACQTASGLSWTSNDNCEKAGPYYVKGKISRISKDKSTGDDLTYAQSGTYSNATFYISDDGSANDEFYCYRLAYLGNKKYSAGKTDIKVGDEVIIYASLMNYQNNTPENSGGYLYSLNGDTGDGTTPDVQPGTPEGDGSLASPFNVAGAIVAVKDLSWTSNSDYQKVGPYYVKGKVSSISQDYTYNISDGRTYGNARFNISDDGKTTSEQFTLYNLYYLDNKKFVAGQTDIKAGDDVIIYAELINYHGDTPENSGGYLYSLNGDTGSGSVPGQTVTGTVAETIAAADNSGVVINEATVAAISKAGIVVTDGTADVYIYFDAKTGETVPAVAIGDKVKVEATKATYGGVPEFTKATVTKLSAGSVTYPEPKNLNPVATSYASNVTEFVQMTGKLKIDGNYTNIEIIGVDPNVRMGSVSQPVDDLNVGSFDGQEVTVTGYFTGLTSNKFISVVATSIAPADPNVKYCSVSPSSVNAKADDTSASFNISSNADWTVSCDNAAFAVSPASGNGAATVTITFTANEGDAPRVAKITVTCADAAVEAVVTVTQAKPGSAEAHPFTSNVTWTGGENFYDQGTTTAQSAVINGENVTEFVKLGKGGVGGDFTVNIPSGTKRVGFFALSWNNKSSTLTLSGAASSTIKPKSNQGVSNNAPYTITTTEEEAYYEVEITNSSTGLKFVATGERVVVWGINAYSN